MIGTEGIGLAIMQAMIVLFLTPLLLTLLLKRAGVYKKIAGSKKYLIIVLTFLLLAVATLFIIRAAPYESSDGLLIFDFCLIIILFGIFIKKKLMLPKNHN